VAGRIAVTGATGFVGPHLVGALARHGWKLRLLVRRWKALPEMAGVDAEIVLGDLDEERALTALTDGVDAVIHAAGLIKARDPADFHRANAESTRRLSAQAPDVPFVLLSSLAAREPLLSPYAASKRAAEDALTGRRRWIAVRAPAVYGPGDRETLAYFKAVARGIAPEPRMSGARLSLIHVADLAEALALAVGRLPPLGVYEVDDGAPGGYSYGDMAAAAGAAVGRGPLGRRPMRLRVPRFGMAAVAALNGLKQRLGGPTEILTAGKVRELFHPDWQIHDRRLAETIRLEPRFDLHAGFADTIGWYRRHHWLQ
jgi:nucleoside-diphosphate-sugar epimerase